MADDAIAPIIVKKKIVAGGGHHGGAWKIAYADFVTAMMAFFLLMWLINATSPDQKTGIANFFTPSNARPSGSGAGGILGGTSIMADGMARAAGTPAQVVISLPSTNADSMGGPSDGKYSGTNVTEILDQLKEDGVDVLNYPEILADLARQTDARQVLRALEAEGVDVFTHPEILDEIFDVASPLPASPTHSEGTETLGDLTEQAMQSAMDQAVGALSEQDLSGMTAEEIQEMTEALATQIARGQAAEAMAAAEQQQFEQTEQAIRQAIDSIPELEPYRDNLRIEQTPEGLRIQIVDGETDAMFPSGSATLHDQTATLVDVIAQVIRELPNDIMITGHTDARPFQTDGGYGNWELSSDRANAARRALIAAGIPEDRIARVVGRADRDPLDADDPFAAVNRRISFVVLSQVPTVDGMPDTGDAAIGGAITIDQEQ
ncbi:MAG: OmpA family protein [Alphaproteobacteria bacterium]